ncbi:hypothetical protein CEXT_122001 [Caerostris extrusa]|uniref:Uncharacterized protein n=1 Tax=Caerostris extrusa TaxID=172846 RepID=A0AAV4W0F4_CAEEX|nr:hypothetical protein CEXT_122001 [Caerostris extrusa]
MSVFKRSSKFTPTPLGDNVDLPKCYSLEKSSKHAPIPLEGNDYLAKCDWVLDCTFLISHESRTCSLKFRVRSSTAFNLAPSQKSEKPRPCVTKCLKGSGLAITRQVWRSRFQPWRPSPSGNGGTVRGDCQFLQRR